MTQKPMKKKACNDIHAHFVIFSLFFISPIMIYMVNKEVSIFPFDLQLIEYLDDNITKLEKRTDPKKVP